MKQLCFLSFTLFFISCSSSTKSRETPGLVLDTLKVASGQPFGASHSDHKYQISLKGFLIDVMECPLLKENLRIALVGPLPASKVLSTVKISDNNDFQIISEANPGKYKISLINIRGNKVISSKEIDATEQRDRFDVNFSSCGQ